MLQQNEILKQNPAPAGARITSFLVNTVRMGYRIGQRIAPQSVDTLGLKELEASLTQHYVASYVRENSIMAAISALPEPAWMPSELHDTHVITKYRGGNESLDIDSYKLWKTGESGQKLHRYVVFDGSSAKGLHSREYIQAAISTLAPEDQAVVAQKRRDYEQASVR